MSARRFHQTVFLSSSTNRMSSFELTCLSTNIVARKTKTVRIIVDVSRIMIIMIIIISYEKKKSNDRQMPAYVLRHFERCI